MLSEEKILYENSTHFVLDCGKRGFEVYRNTITHAVRVASIGLSYGIDYAIMTADKRHDVIERISLDLYALRDADSPTGYDVTKREHVARLQEKYNLLTA